MAYQYQILSHPADVKLKITASSLAELFEGALEGMISIIKPSNSKESITLKEDIEVYSLDLNSLLVDFLNEILAKMEISQAIFQKVIIKTLSSNYLKGELIGTKIDYLEKEIKAVTHHGLEIQQDENNNYHVTILFDI